MLFICFFNPFPPKKVFPKFLARDLKKDTGTFYAYKSHSVDSPMLLFTFQINLQLISAETSLEI